MKAAVILEAEQYEALLQDIRQIKEEQQIQRLIVEQYGWIEALSMMKMGLQGLTTWAGVKAAEKRGELTIDYSKKKARVSAMSLVTLLRRKGYTMGSIQQRVAS